MRNFIGITGLIALFYLQGVYGENIKSSPAGVSLWNKSQSSTKITENNLDMSMRSLLSENEHSKATVFDFKIEYFLTYNINPYIFFKLNPQAHLQSGQVQSIDASDRLENKLSLKTAAIYFTWQKESYAALGVLNTQENLSSLLVSDKGFFSGKLNQNFALTNWQFGALTQASIPNSESAVSNQNEKETTPFLASIGSYTHWNGGGKNTTKFNLNYFKYSQIPYSISTQSIQSGNTPDENRISETEQAFKYDYEGIDSSVSISRNLLKNIFLLGNAGYVINQKAPEALNRASLVSGGIGFSFNHSEVEFSSGYYRIEPDAVLAHYGNSRFFRTNHQGYEVITSFLMKRENFKISLYYNDGRLIYENPNQSDEKIYFLKFEVNNVAI